MLTRAITLFTGKGRQAPPRQPNGRWSIGVLAGHNLVDLRTPEGVANPVITRADIHDCEASFVADPFVIRRDGSWHLFFEIFDRIPFKGVIGHAESADGLRWRYTGVVLSEACHLSYPYVFEHDGECYMLPETKGLAEVRLYRAVRFPHEWTYCKTLLRGRYTDPSIFRHEGRWWMFAGKGPYGLGLFHSENLLDGWQWHRRPYIYFRDKRRSRPGGRVVNYNGALLRFAQDCERRYGHQLRVFRITKLTPREYEEEELMKKPVLCPSGSGWNSTGMHTIDLQTFSDGSLFAVVDGTNEG